MAGDQSSGRPWPCSARGWRDHPTVSWVLRPGSARRRLRDGMEGCHLRLLAVGPCVRLRGPRPAPSTDAPSSAGAQTAQSKAAFPSPLSEASSLPCPAAWLP